MWFGCYCFYCTSCAGGATNYFIITQFSSSTTHSSLIRVKFKSAGYAYVLELYDLPIGFKEKDVLQAFANVRDENGLEVMVVNATTALGIFISSIAGKLPLSCL